MYQTLELQKKQQILTIWLNKPEIHNAFDETMILEIKEVFTDASKDPEIRVVVLRGKGKSFCAGADLNWMRKVSQYTYEQNLLESNNLAACFYAIYTCSKPTVAVVHGAAMGGANGLIAACDIAIADADTTFSLSEVKIGLIPACIGPYILKRVGEARARELMLTGQRIHGNRAEAIGLVNHCVTSYKLEEKVMEIEKLLLQAGPKALQNCKTLIDHIANHLTLEEAKEYTAQMIAKQRISEEGQEGMTAFLEKRKANWVPNFDII